MGCAGHVGGCDVGRGRDAWLQGAGWGACAGDAGVPAGCSMWQCGRACPPHWLPAQHPAATCHAPPHADCLLAVAMGHGGSQCREPAHLLWHAAASHVAPCDCCTSPIPHCRATPHAMQPVAAPSIMTASHAMPLGCMPCPLQPPPTYAAPQPSATPCATWLQPAGAPHAVATRHPLRMSMWHAPHVLRHPPPTHGPHVLCAIP